MKPVTPTEGAACAAHRIDAHALAMALRFANDEACRLASAMAVWCLGRGRYKVLPADQQGPASARKVAVADPP